jgi:ABC-type transport system involved in resistance to organic solvents, periplasmic component
MRKYAKEIQIALVAIVGIVVLYFGLQFLKGLTLFSSDNHYYVKFDDISGLSASSPIYANGYRIGVVERIIYDYEHNGEIVAELGIDNKMQIPKGSYAEIASDLLGNIKLEVKFGPDFDDVMEPGDTINGGLQDGAFGKVEKLLPHLEKALPKLDSILYNVNVLLSDPSLRNSLNNIERMTADLTKVSKDFTMISASLNQQLPNMLTTANGVLTNVDTLTQTLNAIDFVATMAKVDATLQNVQALTAKLNSKEGTVGKFLTDPSIYDHLNSTTAHLDSLIIDLKAHPGRYVHFSLFGKKQK